MHGVIIIIQSIIVLCCVAAHARFAVIMRPPLLPSTRNSKTILSLINLTSPINQLFFRLARSRPYHPYNRHNDNDVIVQGVHALIRGVFGYGDQRDGN